MKRVISLLLATLLVLSLCAACGGTASQTPNQPNTQTPTETAEQSTEEQPTEEQPAEEQPSEEQPAEEQPSEELSTTPTEDEREAFDTVNAELPKGFAEGSVFPICEPGAVTISYWRTANDETLKRGDSPFDDNYAWKAIEEATGVKVEFNLFSSGNYATTFPLMLASNDYPDVAENPIGGGYAGGSDKAIEDGVYVNLAEYKELMPNFLRWVELSAGNHKAAYTDEGNIPFFCQVYDHAQTMFYGYTIRRDWLESTGLSVPTTIAGWHDTLVAFKNGPASGAAPMDMGLSRNGFTAATFIDGAFNVNGGDPVGLIAKNGVIESSFRTQGLYDYLETMAAWYAEGLIDPDFVGQDFFWSTTRLAQGESGILPAMYTQVGTYCADAGMAPAECYMEIMPIPTLDGTERHVYAKGIWASGMGAGGAIIFAGGDHIEEAIRWCDYRYSEEGYMLTNYGVQGETFDYDENGQPYLFDLLANNPEGLSAGFAQELYLVHNGSVVFLLDREENQASAEGIRYNDLWADIGDWTLSGSLTYTADEGEERGGLVTDLQTTINEFCTKVIMGMIELNESSWTDFQNQLTKMGLDRVVEITQAAYNRFLAR